MYALIGVTQVAISPRRSLPVFRVESTVEAKSAKVWRGARPQLFSCEPAFNLRKLEACVTTLSTFNMLCILVINFSLLDLRSQTLDIFPVR